MGQGYRCAVGGLISSAAKVSALLGNGFTFAGITCSTYDVEPDPIVAPTLPTAPEPARRRPRAAADLVLPPTSDAATQITATGIGIGPTRSSTSPSTRPRSTSAEPAPTPSAP